jgi:uncharacterized protein YndB with AHSA1/START domain
MWTDPKHLEQWFGPRGFTTTVEADVRPGGSMRTVMYGPDGTAHPMTGVYREVIEPERLVYTQDLSQHPAEWQDYLNSLHPDGKAGLQSVTAVTFEEENGGTKLTITTTFESAGDRVAMEKLGMNEGWQQTLDRLAEQLATA